MTAEEFAASYAERSTTTVESLRARGREPRPCGCGDTGCHGWQMVNAAEYEQEYVMFTAGHGPDPSRGADRR